MLSWSQVSWVLQSFVGSKEGREGGLWVLMSLLASTSHLRWQV